MPGKTGLGRCLANGFQEACGAEAGDVAGVFRHIEADADVALRSKVIDLVGLEVVEEAREAGRVAEVAVVEEELHAVDVGVHVKMIDPLGVEGAGTADDAVNFVALGEEQFGEVGTVLAGDSGDKGLFTHGELT